MPRSASRPVIITYKTRQDAIKARDYLKLLHGEKS